MLLFNQVINFDYFIREPKGNVEISAFPYRFSCLVITQNKLSICILLKILNMTQNEQTLALTKHSPV